MAKDLDKILKRAIKGRKLSKARVEKDAERRMGPSEFRKLQERKAEHAHQTKESTLNNNVIRTMNVRINESEEGSSKEKRLIRKRNAMQRALKKGRK